MAQTVEQDLDVRQGATFTQVFRWGKLPIVYKPISALSATPPLQVTATAHGVPDGWPVAITATGTGVDAEFDPPGLSDYHQATLVDANDITLNDVNPALLDFGTYVSGGVLQYYTPQSLTGFTASMNLYAPAGTTPAVLTVTSTAPTTGGSEIVLDTTNQTITVNLTATDTAALEQISTVYELGMTDGSGNVTIIAVGSINVLAVTDSPD